MDTRGDTDDLGYTNSEAFKLISGSLKDSGNDVLLTLPVPGQPNSLSYNKDIVLDNTGPKIINVTSQKPDGVYTVGDTIPIIVEFDDKIIVTRQDARLALITN